jgi:alpha-L-rhamnosidase
MRCVMQEAYRLRIKSDTETVYDSGEVMTSQSIEVAAEGFTPFPSGSYCFEVEVKDNHGCEATGNGYFEAAPKSLSAAKWVEPPFPSVNYEEPISLITSAILKRRPKLPVDKRLLPVTLLRKEFQVKADLIKARAYVTAHGVYNIRFNGKPPDERLFAPEYTSYDKYLCYQTYDITALLQEGANACGVMLGDGWWAGRIGMGGECGQYGRSRAFLMQIVLYYNDGSIDTVISDEHFKASDEGPIRYSDIFIGEKQDNNYLEKIEGYSEPGFDDQNWAAVKTADYNYENLYPQSGNPVMKFKEIKPAVLITTPKGESVIDFGQNFAGFVRLCVSEPKGGSITLEHSEVLDKKGNFINNIMGVNKDQKDVFVCSGKGGEVFEPLFTFHGFRYVKVTGITKLNLDDFCGIAITSQMENLVEFSCSNEGLNRLYSNARWSEYANMLSIPTDCPQRERAGWLGDIQVYAPTAAFHQDMNVFLTRWLDNMEADQLDDGQIPNVIPYTSSYRSLMMKQFKSECSAGWGEACMIVPYVLYKTYGSEAILKKHYSMMKKWMDYVKYQAENSNSSDFNKKKNKTEREIENRKYLWDTKWHYGDWMIPSISKGMTGSLNGAKKTKEFTASAYYAYSSELMSRIAAVLGLKDDALMYLQQNKRIKQAIVETFVFNNGRIKPDLQGSYVMALAFGILEGKNEGKAVARLKELIEKNGGCLDTGFLSTPLILDVLMKYDLKDLAYRILYQEKCPSWLYEIKKGATTIWESWDGIKPDGNVGNLSYNHYAFGCVCDWIYRNIAGIRNADVGYKKIIICPEPDETLTRARCSYRSVYGEIVSDWKKEDGKFILKVKIPPNTTALIILPGGERQEVGSGEYRYEVA